MAYVLPNAVSRTLLLLAGVGLLTLIIGAGTAWLVTMYRFPGRGLFEWLLLIPLAVPTYIICGLFLPAAYVGFCLLQRSRAYLGDDRPSGRAGAAWLVAMIGVTAFLIAFLGWYVVDTW